MAAVKQIDRTHNQRGAADHCGRQAIAREGHNCWRQARASRLAVVIDGENYFRAVREVILAAQKTVFIVGWDIHSQLQLVHDAPDDGYPCALGELLDQVARDRGVDIYILSWDFAMIYWLERESLPLYRLDWKTNDRVHFHMDDDHPVGASQHQKLVVIDDALAFCGGFDLSKWRWDSREHRPDDMRRVDPEGDSYPPFHDVQMAVAGDAARCLGELCRERWLRATGEAPQSSATVSGEAPWPASVKPLLQDVTVTIARTMPGLDDAEAVREVEQLYLDMVVSAGRWIYIENQYLSSHRIADALAERLGEREGPEIVVVLPLETGGWLEQHTMDVLRSRLVKKLEAEDVHDRLRVFYPRLAGGDRQSLIVHAKLMVIDDRLLRVGSSNLSNRSMGLDSECDLAIEAESEPVQNAIAGIRDDLMAEHLGVPPEDVADAVRRHNSLIGAIEELSHGERRLAPLETSVSPEVDRLVPDAAIIDPEKPVTAEEFVRQFVPLRTEAGFPWRLVNSGLLLLLFAGLAGAWRWTSLGNLLDVDALVAQARSLNDHPATPLLAILAISVAGCLAVPMTLLVVASVLAFGSLAGFVYALAGGEISAIITYGAGHVAGRDLVRRYAGDRLNSISRAMARRGVLTMVALRMVPVAPFVVINTVAGASRIELRDFALGTLLGMAPGMLAIAFFSEGLIKAVQDPQAGSLAGLLLLLVLALAVLFVLRRWLRRARE